LYGVKRARTLH